MPSKKRKYNARFPAGRIKKIMQTDEEVGKVAQAVPIIISRTLELFVESLLGKALQVTSARNAKTLSPSHVKQCILAEARFDFLRDLVKNIPDVSAAEEKELMSAESSPNSSRFTETAATATAPPRRIAREDSNSSSSCEIIRVPQVPPGICSSREQLKRALSSETEISHKTAKIEPSLPGTSAKIEPSTSLIPSNLPLTGLTTQSELLAHLIAQPGPSVDTAIDLSKKETKTVRTANFYQETLIDDVPQSSVIKINPIYTPSQPSTSYTSLNSGESMRKVEILPSPTFERHNSLPRTPLTPYAPVINIDFSKNIAKPEIKVLDVPVTPSSVPVSKPKHLSRQNSKSKTELKKLEVRPVPQLIPVDIDKLNSGNLQIDEDYDT